MAWSYYITDRHTSRRPILEQIQIAIEAGVDYVQIREKDLSSRKLFDLAVSARGLAERGQARILINDRLDVALAAGLDGVHLGQQSIAPEFIRLRVPNEDFLIGVSTHTLPEVEQAHRRGVSFLVFGPVFLSPSKALYGPPAGIENLKEACGFSKVPVFALGGINQQNYSDCLGAGATGIAGIRLFQSDRKSVAKLVQEIHSFPAAG